MKTSKIIFRDENLNQDIILNCQLSDEGDLEFNVSFDPPVSESSDLGTLSGQLCKSFCEFLKG